MAASTVEEMTLSQAKAEIERLYEARRFDSFKLVHAKDIFIEEVQSLVKFYLGQKFDKELNERVIKDIALYKEREIV